MSISSIGGMSSQAVPYNSQSATNGAKKSEGGSDKELTTITTHCNKNHEHNQSCPHTVSTKPAPKEGEPGSHLDKSV